MTGPSFRAEPLEGSEQEKATYSLHKRRKILRLVSQWVLLYGRLLQGDRSTTALLQVPGAGMGQVGGAEGVMSPEGSGGDHPHRAPSSRRTSQTWRAKTLAWAGWSRSKRRTDGGPERESPGQEGCPQPEQSLVLSPHPPPCPC